MAAIMSDDIFKSIFFNESEGIPFQIFTDIFSQESSWQ